MGDDMLENNLVALVTALTLGLFVWMTLRVAKARATFGIAAPATAGNAEFERHFRVQMNTLEGLVVFLPALWLFTLYWGQIAAALLGLAWLAGRIVYMLAYVKEPKSRGLGFAIQGGASLLLILGVVIGALKMMIIKGGL